MTDQTDVSRASSARTAVSQAVRTFVVVAALLAVVAVLGLVLLETSGSVDLTVIPVWVSIPLVLGVSTLVTGWLVNGGYERFDADPSAAGQFGWLALLYAQVAFVPTQAALVAAGLEPTAGLAIGVVAAIALAGWLTAFGGLDRLGIEMRHVAHAAGVAIALYICGSVVGPYAVPQRFLTPIWIASAALSAQVTALWLGFGGYVDRFLA